MADPTHSTQPPHPQLRVPGEHCARGQCTAALAVTQRIPLPTNSRQQLDRPSPSNRPHPNATFTGGDGCTHLGINHTKYLSRALVHWLKGLLDHIEEARVCDLLFIQCPWILHRMLC